MRRALSFGLATVAVGATSFLTVRLLPSSPVSKPAFTAILQESTEEYVAGAVRQREAKLFYAARADGSTVDGLITPYPEGREYTVRSVTLVPERKYVVVIEAIESVSTTPLSTKELVTLTAPPGPNCVTKGTTVLGYEKLMGHDVVKLQRKGKFYNIETWQAPALHCFALKSVKEVRNTDGSLNTRTIRTAVSLALGDPAAELFMIPTGYVERPPSQMNIEEGRRLLGYVPQCLIDAAPKLDRNYYRSRSAPH
ncbi:MAG: hypothetical protein AAB225_12915 [Acidobacteriota bacterium]